MVTNYTSSKNVIAKVYSDLNIQEESHRVSDMMDWIGEAVEKIGAISNYITKITTIKIKNYQATVPSDLHHLNQVAFSFNDGNLWIPVKRATGNFDVWSSDKLSEDTNIVVKDSMLVDVIKTLYGTFYNEPMTYETAMEILNSNSNIKETLINQFGLGQHIHRLSDGSNLKANYRIVYSMKPGYLNCNAPEGFFKLSYEAIPLDEENYPLIPDIASVFEAIYWYITMKLKFSEWLDGRIKTEQYYRIENKWNFYRKQAYAELMMPSQDEMENIKATNTTLVPDLHSHDNFDRNLNLNEIVYNQNTNHYGRVPSQRLYY